MPVRILDWSLFGEVGVNLTSGQSVDTGGVAVTLGFVAEDEGATVSNFAFPQYVAEGEPFDPSEGLKLFGQGGEDRPDDTSTTTLSFASTDAAFGNAVENVSFRINDLDNGQNGLCYQDIVTIRAYDSDGNLVPVTLTPGADIAVSGQTATGVDTTPTVTPPTDPDTSLLVNIVGPVERIEIDYDNLGPDIQTVWVSDVEFHTTPAIADGPDGYVDGNDEDNLIDALYDGDPNGDFIDRNDQILPGEGENDDIVRAMAGNDTVIAGDGDDEVFGGDGNDSIYGQDGNDILRGEAGDDTILGGEGDDTVKGGDGNDVIDTGNGDDIVDPGAGDDTVSTGAGNDTVVASLGHDEIDGGIGNDHLSGGAGNDEIIGGEGADKIYGGAGNDTILGGTGNDTILGGEGVNDLQGGDDADTFERVGAGDTVDGGTGDSGGGDFDTLDLRHRGLFEIVNQTVDADGDSTSGMVNYLDKDGNVTGTLDFFEIENLIPCFTPGTVIATPRGERRVEDLSVGDRIITRDNGLQEIRWIGQRDMTGQELEKTPHLKPVLIQAGSLGHGLPERDLLVSPQHRMLINSERAALYFEEREVLAAAKHLTGLKGVDVVECSAISYIHFMFDQHEVVLSNGSWTESFQPGEQVLDGMGTEQRDEIFDLFPELREKDGLDAYQSARRSLKKHEAKIVID